MTATQLSVVQGMRCPICQDESQINFSESSRSTC